MQNQTSKTKKLSHFSKTNKMRKAILLIIIIISLLLLLTLLLNRINNTHFNSNITTNIQVEVGDTFTLPEANVSLCGNILFKNPLTLKVTTSGSYDTSKIGKYTIKYKANHLFYTYSAIQTINVVDSTPPVITLNYIDGYYTLPDSKYEEEGYTATDNYDNDITDKVHSEEIDGIVYYTVTDSSGNTATAERKIIYDDKTAPELTLSGDSEILLNAGDSYEEPGYTAIDNIDGDITDKVEVNNSVNIYAAGTYTITYSVEDSYGNVTTATRSVIVKALQNSINTVTPSGKIIYLTFDDGPSQYTEQLLSVLSKYNAKATFFVVNGSYNNLIKKEYSEGHSVGVHSYSHNYSLIYSSTDAYWNDFNAMNQVIKDQTGNYASFFRFPGGSSNTVSKQYCSGIMSKLAFNASSMGYQYFDWNVTSGDAGQTTNTNQVVQNVINGISGKNIAIVLQHDSKAFSVNAVEQILIWGLSNGYTFMPLDISSPAAHQHINN